MKLSNNEIIWDEIVSIKSVGREHVYDIEVEGTHNFIGNGIFAHNTYVSGNVGIGTTNPGYAIDVVGAAGLSTGTLWTNTSDSRVKTEILEIPNALALISDLKPSQYKYTAQYLAAHPEIGSQTHYGFIAQDFQQVFSDGVSTGPDGFLRLNASNVIPYAIAGIKELDIKLAENGQIVGEQGEKLITVDEALKALVARVSELENRGQINRGTESFESAPPSSVPPSSVLQSVLVTATGVVPAELNYGMGLEATTSGEQRTDKQINGVTESSSSATPSSVTLSSGLQSTPSAGVKDSPLSAQGESFVASISAEIAASGSAVLAMTEASPSSYPSSEATSSARSSDSGTFISDIKLNTFNNIAVRESLKVFGALSVFGQSTFANTNVAGILTVDNVIITESGLSAYGKLQLQPFAQGTIEMMAGSVSVNEYGDVVIHSGNLVLEAGQIFGNDTMRGSITFDVGSTFAVVTQSWSKAPKSVVVTPGFNTRAWVEKLGENGFVIRVDSASDHAQKVYWIAVW